MENIINSHSTPQKRSARLPKGQYCISCSSDEMEAALKKFEQLFCHELLSIMGERELTYSAMVNSLSPAVDTSSHLSSILSGKDNRRVSPRLILMAHHVFNIKIDRLLDTAWSTSEH